MHNQSPNEKEREKMVVMVKGKNVLTVLRYILECLSDGSMKHADLYETAVFYRLSGRFPDITLGDATAAVDCARTWFNYI